MTKARKYWILAVIMGLLGLVEAITGFVLWLGFPTGGGGGGRGWVAVALVALVVLHMVLHWKWIVRVGKNLFKGTPRKLIPVPVRND